MIKRKNMLDEALERGREGSCTKFVHCCLGFDISQVFPITHICILPWQTFAKEINHAISKRNQVISI